MGNEKVKGLSVNAKTLILILLFVNVGFAIKMINKYYAMKDAGYIREKTFREQVQKRMMKAFGSVEEMNKIVTDVTRQKDEAEKVVASLKGQDEQLRLVNAQLQQTKAQLESEKARLQKEIWALEDSLSLARKTMANKDVAIEDLTKKIGELQAEIDVLNKQIEEHSKTPGAWSIPQ